MHCHWHRHRRRPWVLMRHELRLNSHISPPVLLCCIAHQKKTKKADSADESTTGSTSTSFFFTYDVPQFRRNSSLTSERKVHHPAIDSSVLSLQCGKAVAVFVSSRHRDFDAQVGKCGSRSLDLFFLVRIL